MEGQFTTLILVAITCLVSFIAFDNQRLMASLVFWPPAVTEKNDYSRFITYGFVHGSGSHLLFNMVTLYFFGRAMEGFFNDHLGAFGFAFFYLLGLVVSIVPSYLRHKNDKDYFSLGASGAVAAVLFAFILLEPWTMIYVFFVRVPAILYAVAYVAYSIWADRRGKDRINHSAHLWGAAYGLIFMILMDSRVIGVFLERLSHPRLGG